MMFRDLLSGNTEVGAREILAEPACFADLNLDQVIGVITAPKQEYNLKPFYYAPVKDIDTIRYRQEIMRDLDHGSLLPDIELFAQQLRTVRRDLAFVEKLDFKYHREGWFLEAVATYCEAVERLADDLSRAELRSRGLLAFREYLTRYTGSAGFQSLVAQTQALKNDLLSVKYCLLIRGNRVRVRRYGSESDYRVDVEDTFAKFRQGAVKDYRANLLVGTGMNHVEAQILDLVAKLYPEIFAALDAYCTQNAGFLDPTISVFDREIQFYVAYLQYIAKFRPAGLKFCYPQVAGDSKALQVHEGFDLALAGKCLAEGSTVVRNDFFLKDRERVLVISGPNQGGKTTFARMFGQLHYLASLGCPVPGSQARLFLFDQLFTHFEREEDIRDLRGKLQDDLVRIRAILDQATPNSVIVINEIFSSTTAEDAAFLAREIMQKILKLDLLCVCVTFIDELASLNEQTVSMVSTIVPENPALRTYKIVRRPADGLAYALSIAEKYRLTYDSLKDRIQG